MLPQKTNFDHFVDAAAPTALTAPVALVAPVAPTLRSAHAYSAQHETRSYVICKANAGTPSDSEELEGLF